MAKQSTDYSQTRRYELGSVAEHLSNSKDMKGAGKSLDQLVIDLNLQHNDDVSGLISGTKASAEGIRAAAQTYASKDRVRRYGLRVSELPDFYSAEFSAMFSDDRHRDLGRSIFQKYEGKTWKDLEQEFEGLNDSLKKIHKYEDIASPDVEKRIKETVDKLKALNPVKELIDRMYSRRISSLAEPFSIQGEVEENDSIAEQYGVEPKKAA